MFRAVLVLLALAVATAAFAQSRPPACTSAEHRQFDFWIGDWEVTGAQGKVVGNTHPG